MMADIQPPRRSVTYDTKTALQNFQKALMGHVNNQDKTTYDDVERHLMAYQNVSVLDKSAYEEIVVKYVQKHEGQREKYTDTYDRYCQFLKVKYDEYIMADTPSIAKKKALHEWLNMLNKPEELLTLPSDTYSMYA